MLIRNDPVNAFLGYEHVAVAHAEEGPLKGLTFGVKDLYDVAGYPTGAGSPLKATESPVHSVSAPIVQVMLDAGAEFVGKTQTDELAFSLNGQNMHFPEPINVRAEGRITGGSSSGSAAAVAAGLCDFALGSDTGGSIRAPGSYCGLWGIRPTHERVSLDGVSPLAPSLDTPGYFADSPEIFGRVAPVFLGQDNAPVRPTRLLIAEDAFALLLSDREAAALAPARNRITDHFEIVEPVTISREGLYDWYSTFRHIQAFEAWREHGAWIQARNPVMTPGVRDRFEFGKGITAEQKAELDAKRVRQRQRVDEILEQDTLVLMPSVPSIAPLRDMPFDELQAFRERALSLLCISGLSGAPQVQMPVAELDHCPIGLSLLGPRGSDLSLIEIAIRAASH